MTVSQNETDYIYLSNTSVTLVGPSATTKTNTTEFTLDEDDKLMLAGTRTRRWDMLLRCLLARRRASLQGRFRS